MKAADNPAAYALMAARDYGISTIMFRNSLAKRFKITLTESICLTMLGVRGSASPGELARFAGLTTGATTTLLDRLEKRGFIRRLPNPEDRRGIIIVPDGAWNARAGALVAGISEANAKLAASCTPEDLELVGNFLRKLAENTTREAERIDAGSGAGGDSD